MKQAWLPWLKRFFTIEYSMTSGSALGPGKLSSGGSSVKPSRKADEAIVAHAEATILQWSRWAPRLRSEYMLPVALAVQNGMTPEDVQGMELQPDIIFVGGTAKWKWASLSTWCKAFPRVHVGRVNTDRQLRIARDAGAESCDGTGWFRGKSKQIAQLGHFLREQAGHPDDGDVDRVVYHSRLKHQSQKAFPFEATA